MMNRRTALTLMRGMGSVVLVGGLSQCAHSTRSTTTPPLTPAATKSARPGCIVRPQQTEGPYFVDTQLNRTDIRANPGDGVVTAGVPLQLAFRLSQIQGNQCQPLAGAIVDVWHCDAMGVYSGVSDRSFNTQGQKFLRGYQVTDAAGVAQFQTIYPGWYPGRTVHIHFKVRATANRRNYEFTSQLYFDDLLTDLVQTQRPYAQRGQRSTQNDDDGIFRQGGSQLLLALSPAGAGYAATFDLGLQLA